MGSEPNGTLRRQLIPFQLTNAFALLAKSFYSLYTQGGPKKRNGILPVIEVYNDWYRWMGYLLLRKMIPRSAILVKVFFIFILEHIMSDHVGLDRLRKNAFRLAIIVSDNPINRLCQWAFFTPARGLFTIKGAKEGVIRRSFYKICGGRGPPE